MATYPDYRVLMASDHELEQGHKDDFSQAGTHHSRKYHNRQYHRFTLVHSLTPAEFDELMLFYEDGPRDYHLHFYHEVPYTSKFLGPPQPTLNREDRKYIVKVDLRGIPAESY